jgi:protein-S-isoprenylcysteine O-methyltransferase Ste14
MSTEMEEICQRVPRSYFWKGQLQHLFFLLLLIPGALWWLGPVANKGTFLSLNTKQWIVLHLAVVVTHQLLAWLVFRLQMCFALFNQLFGKAALIVWGILFFPFLFARPLLLLAIGWIDRGSLTAVPYSLLVVGGLLLLVPALYTLWSVKHYFGFSRAIGGDHFFRRYREMPLVRKGAFHYSDNAMYSFAFLALWAVALLFASRAALVMALFQHAYIWVHMYCTEESDLAILYTPKTMEQNEDERLKA